MSVAQKHRAAVKAWASSSAGGGSGSSARHVPLGQTYYADPLNLSPLSHMPYLFVAYARRMLADSGSEAGVEVRGPRSALVLCSDMSPSSTPQAHGLVCVIGARLSVPKTPSPLTRSKRLPVGLPSNCPALPALHKAAD